MKNFFFSCFFIVFANLDYAAADNNAAYFRDLTKEMSQIQLDAGLYLENSYTKVSNVAQYKHANWDNLIGLARNISLKEAYLIADSNPEITYFFYMTGYQMALETDIPGEYRVFHSNDAVFFTGKPWWGSAIGFADGYIKEQKQN